MNAPSLTDLVIYTVMLYCSSERGSISIMQLRTHNLLQHVCIYISSGADLGYVQSVARLTYFLQRNINLLFQNLNNLFPLRL